MLRIRFTNVMLCLVGALALFLGSLAACPFCLSPPQTLAEQMRRADIVVVAELVSFEVFDEGTRPESTLRIREFLQPNQLCPQLTTGSLIVLHAEAAGDPGELFLMFGSKADDPSTTTFAVEVASGQTEAGESITRDNKLIRDNNVTPAGLPEASTVSNSAKTALNSEVTTIAPEMISWNDTTLISPATLEYLRALPDASLTQAERLLFYIPFLEHSDPAISIDAWAEFGNSTYEQVASVRNMMPRERLIQWIADPAMSPERLGLYGMMLGLCGDPKDADFLLHQVCLSYGPVVAESFAAEQLSGIPGSAALHLNVCFPMESPQLRFGSDGILAGYLLLAKEPGLEELERRFAHSGDVSLELCKALQFLWSYESTLIERERLVQSMRLLLPNETIRSIVIANLCRWEDWGILPQLQAEFEESTEQAAQRAIIDFTQTYLRTANKGTATEAWLEASEDFLQSAKANHPELFSARFGDFRSPGR